MNIEYIGVPEANIEGRYNDMYYFMEKIVGLEQHFLKNIKASHIMYNNTEEFDDITVVPYEKGIVYKIDNLDSDYDNNNTTASLIVTDNNVHFIITKADWDHNRVAEVQRTVVKNNEKEQELITNLGEQLEVDKLGEYDPGKGLAKIGQEMREKRQRKDYEKILNKSMNILKQAVVLFGTNINLKSLKASQEALKLESDQKELIDKQISSIPQEQLDIMYQFSTGQIDQNTAVMMMQQYNEKVQKEQQGIPAEQLKILYDCASGNIDNQTASQMLNQNIQNDNSINRKTPSDWQ